MEISKSDLLRQWISEKLNANFDYSLASNKNQDFEDFFKAHPESKSDLTNDKKLYLKILNQTLTKKSKDKKDSVADARKTPKPPQVNQDMIGKIEPKPQPEQTTEAQASTEKTETTEQKTTYVNFDEKAVGACFAALWCVPKYAYGDFLDNLTDEEKETLGRLWLPAFKKYLSENWAIVGMPLIVTLGMMAPKLAKARKLKKLNEGKEKDRKKVEELTCKYCNKLFQKDELKAHELACEKRK